MRDRDNEQIERVTLDGASEQRGARNTLLHNDIKVLVLHPRDQDGEVIIRALQRAGCQVQNLWHPRLPSVSRFDVVFFLASEDAYRQVMALTNRTEAAVVAVIEGESSTTDQLLADCCPHAALCKPVSPAHVLTSLTLARNLLRYENRLQAKVRKLEETLRSVRTVEKAKTILMTTKDCNEKEAYDLLRKSAMNRRVPIGQIASAVVEANDVFKV